MSALPDPEILPLFQAPYAPDDGPLIRSLSAELDMPPEAEDRAALRARGYIRGIRDARGTVGGLEDFMQTYSLSTREGLALMALAEALLRVPDAATQDRLIEDKLGGRDWSEAARETESWIVSATTWALGMSVRIVHPGETAEGIVGRLAQRLGMPTIRTAARQAMRLLGHQFVLGETIEGALRRARTREERGYRHSFDMLGEGARTAEDARRYRESYVHALEAIGRSAGGEGPEERPGLSVKLSALHPRYAARQRDRVLRELTPDLVELARLARRHDLNLTIDAEEADRLELSLEVFALLVREPSLAGWEGLGLAVQAYQKRAPALVAWLDDAARASGRRLMVRLVKGAYWDTEVKRAQERGLDDFPVFTRKAATDLSYLVCARRLLAARPRIFPQFATHNALTVASVIEMAEGGGYEFQRLHGMGDDLYAQVHDRDGHPCRIYAPVGGYRELLAYLVRRLLENGANSSFVNIVADPDVPIDGLVAHPHRALEEGPVRHARIRRPSEIFPGRRNSSGVEFGDRRSLAALVAGMAAVGNPIADVGPLLDGRRRAGAARAVLSPSDGATIVGRVEEADPSLAGDAVAAGLAGFARWDETPAGERAGALERAADLLEARRDRLMALLAREAGKTLDDAVAEIREAVDFLRYYAAEGRRLFASDMLMPGPTGEENRYRLRGRGVFVCISPWNFPLAIFTGQVAAALAAGNAVVAKPAEQTPLVAFEAVSALHEAGVPPAALGYLPGDGRVGAALVAEPRIAGVAFTGSTAVAQSINRTLAARTGPIIPFIAETGGINAMIADATALPEQVADDVVASAFRSAGQRCSATRLLFVQAEVADAMVRMIAGAAAELAVGDPSDPATDVGPVIDAEARDALAAHIERVRREQAVRYAGAVPERGFFVAPHLVELDRPSYLDREVFGPVLHVVRWRSGELQSVIDSVRATGYGLTLGIHTRVGGRAERISRAVQVGNVYVNRNTIGAVVGAQPFGGAGLSGTGPKAGGPNYLQRFALEQVVSTDTTAAGGNASLVTLADTG
ncbi:bifunctional proline dehydrogenase/L-glutamate gamma-semialdehyde dehydrogenase PutA [Propylenella binzhouense]|uniref:Bifunctional protein PutA n=1 Tax=Propylenella binzhouense TaxID=2555902 RepID=A0A964T5N1_9HYPH|nr:bifunctional proline dehydrogenase/L-glutamate gamma-semialdehyde dehydrogenase PutA [Propylenella binzhouense]MYZ48870.1 bifunctional proline dehydrogenase/L-glutamate gamma-semialdehyde dehydrogenase PutA [Propylenella binzhouense]